MFEDHFFRRAGCMVSEPVPGAGQGGEPAVPVTPDWMDDEEWEDLEEEPEVPGLHPRPP
jgi:hypothetical protein